MHFTEFAIQIGRISLTNFVLKSVEFKFRPADRHTHQNMVILA